MAVNSELALHEVRIGQGDAFQFHGQLEQRVVFQAQGREHFLAGFLHQLGARVVVLVDAVAEAHQAEAGGLVLGLEHGGLDVVGSADLFQHLQHGFVGTAVGRTPQRGDARSDRRIRVGTGRTDQAHGRGRRVLLVVGMQDEQQVQRLERIRHGDGLGAVGARHVVDVARHRAARQLVGGDLAGQRHAQHGAAVERTRNGDDARTAGGRACNLDGVFNGFDAGREERGLLQAVDGGQAVDAFGQRDLSSWADTAALTLGCRWPVFSTAMPPAKSMYSLPLASHSVAFSARPA
ncbi:hypothetical protein G6F31_015364 [Rhizopus arrhizus]|nr:hypothetical protein G6F31_015364 [Rhizopus arrhizus]